MLAGILQQQNIHSIILSPLFFREDMVGLLGADNPPPEKMENISILFDVLAYFVSSLVSERELQKLREAQNVQCQMTGAVSQPRYTGKTLLLVDDSKELLKCNERVLRPDGYTIYSAGTIYETKEILDKVKPDVMVMDIDLPDGNGLDFCRELRQSTGIPVVFLTAHSEVQMVRKGMEVGGCAFLTKPYQLEELQGAVADAVEGKGWRFWYNGIQEQDLSDVVEGKSSNN